MCVVIFLQIFIGLLKEGDLCKMHMYAVGPAQQEI